MGHLILL